MNPLLKSLYSLQKEETLILYSLSFETGGTGVALPAFNVNFIFFKKL